MTTDQTPAKYQDYYALLTYADFLAHEAAGTLGAFVISEGRK